MGAHHAVAKIPVDRPNHFCTYRRRCATERMPDNVVALIHGDDVGLNLIVVPGDCSVIGHLSTATGEKHRRVQCHLVAFNADNFSTALVGKTIFKVEQFCFHH